MLMSKAPASLLPACGACGLYKSCQSPKMPVSGDGRRKILIVGEAPGEDEDKENLQFVGKTGRRLDKTLHKVGIDMREDCWLTNTLICRPPDNASPTDEQIEYCRPNFRNTVKDLDPYFIIPLGAAAVQTVIGSFWREDVGSISTWAGFRIPSQIPNAWICPTFHPSYIERLDTPVADLIWLDHFKAIADQVEEEDRPWETLPEYEKKVKLIYNGEEAEWEIKRFRSSDMVAIDFETTTKKPESEGAAIVSCALSDGIRTIAYPWVGKAIDATIRFACSPIPKIASNMKFEDRISRYNFGAGMRNWYWDTMVGAHFLDQRPGITSLKFQAYLRLGIQSYNDHIEEWLRAKKGTKVNRILEEVNLKDLLLYNGLDALYEWEVALRQMKEQGYPLPC